MNIPYITIGCNTTGGGKVITGNNTFLVDGIPIACIGDKATCPKHKTVSTIITGDPYLQVMGKSVARVNDVLSCGCKILPKQNLVVGDTKKSNSSSNLQLVNNLISSTTSYSKKFQIVDDLDKTPLGNIYYEIITQKNKYYGTTDQNGYTELIEEDSLSELTINILCMDDHNHEH